MRDATAEATSLPFPSHPANEYACAVQYDPVQRNDMALPPLFDVPKAR